jgi:uncharacterized membrane-anchored protein YhcB (DUF1043 family)
MSALGIALLAFVLGAAVALVSRWLIGGPSAREVELAEELVREKERLTTHREAVEKHFEQTGQLFQDLSYQHALLYRHLSDGMRALCGEGPSALPAGPSPRELAEPEIELGGGEDASPAPRPAKTFSRG